MILTCPNCGTQYVVKDGAVPPEGRQVRCAACKHSWHQDPEPSVTNEEPQAQAAQTDEVTAAPEAVDATPDQPAGDESLAEAVLIEPRSGPEAEERAYEEAVIDGGGESASAQPPAAETDVSPSEGTAAEALEPADDWDRPPDAEAAPDMFTPFAAEDEVTPKRRSAVTSIIIIALVVIVAAALFWLFAPPEIRAKLGLVGGGSSPLALVTTHMDRQQLESGNQLLTVTGRVINPTAREQDVPPLQAQLRTKAGKVVYSWTIQPPARTLPAGASASFNSAEVNVPPGGDELTITLGGPGV